MIARPTDHILCGMASPKSFVSSYPHNYLVILPLNVMTEIFTKDKLLYESIFLGDSIGDDDRSQCAGRLMRKYVSRGVFL